MKNKNKQTKMLTPISKALMLLTIPFQPMFKWVSFHIAHNLYPSLQFNTESNYTSKNNN